MCQGQVGGFREIAITDKEVIAVADFAVEVRNKKEKVALPHGLPDPRPVVEFFEKAWSSRK